MRRPHSGEVSKTSKAPTHSSLPAHIRPLTSFTQVRDWSEVFTSLFVHCSRYYIKRGECSLLDYNCRRCSTNLRTQCESRSVSVFFAQYHRPNRKPNLYRGRYSKRASGMYPIDLDGGRGGDVVPVDLFAESGANCAFTTVSSVLNSERDCQTATLLREHSVLLSM